MWSVYMWAVMFKDLSMASPCLLMLNTDNPPLFTSTERNLDTKTQELCRSVPSVSICESRRGNGRPNRVVFPSKPREPFAIVSREGRRHPRRN
nr:hypothetical protein Iba_chr14dCG0180 [Ipomoea batatas]